MLRKSPRKGRSLIGTLSMTLNFSSTTLSSTPPHINIMPASGISLHVSIAISLLLIGVNGQRGMTGFLAGFWPGGAGHGPPGAGAPYRHGHGGFGGSMTAGGGISATTPYDTTTYDTNTLNTFYANPCTDPTDPSCTTPTTCTDATCLTTPTCTDDTCLTTPTCANATCFTIPTPRTDTTDPTCTTTPVTQK
ncbi:hypothetical protein ABVK25_008183 [Lepraria finkii]|uniref:Uncharacterized protein n=1 Tax=Lepraria finkii TaxID=1340010 RepID=A0ABR4B0U8_9LECA